MTVSETNKSGRSSAWLERRVWDAEVARSNRVAPTFLQKLNAASCLTVTTYGVFSWVVLVDNFMGDLVGSFWFST